MHTPVQYGVWNDTKQGYVSEKITDETTPETRQFFDGVVTFHDNGTLHIGDAEMLDRCLRREAVEAFHRGEDTVVTCIAAII